MIWTPKVFSILGLDFLGTFYIRLWNLVGSQEFHPFFFFCSPMLCGSCSFQFLSLQYCSCCSKSGADCDFMLLLCQPAADITLRRSTRKRRVLLHVDYASDNTDPKGTEVRVCSFASHVCHYSLLAGLLLVC